MHAQFEGSGVRFFASDNEDAEPMKGSALIFVLDDRNQTEALFNHLAHGGQVTTSLAVLPDHLHCIWTLPPNHADFSKRWRLT